MIWATARQGLTPYRPRSIYCKKCKEDIWVGQLGGGSDRVVDWMYTEDREIELLEKFLMRHMGHELEFNNDLALEDKYLLLDTEEN